MLAATSPRVSYQSHFLIGFIIVLSASFSITDTKANPVDLTPVDHFVEVWQSAESPRILIAAHRGGYENDFEDQAPENSLANLERAIEKGYEVYETDLQRTKEDHWIVMHDRDIVRETTGEGEVASYTLAELLLLFKR